MKILARLNSLRSKWTATDFQVFRTCGLVFFLFAAIISLPSLLGVILNFKYLRSATVGNLASYLLSSFGLALGTAITSTIAGAALFTEATRIRNRKLLEFDNFRRFGYLMLGLSLLVLFPLISSISNFITHELFPFRMPFAVIDFFRSFLSLFYRFCFLGVPMLRHHEAISWVFYGQYMVVLNAFGLAVFSFAIDLLKRSKQSTPMGVSEQSALVNRAQGLVCTTKTNIHHWIDTDVKAYRACGVVCFLFAAILVLPVVWFQVTTVLFHGKITTVVDIWLTSGSRTNSFTIIPTLLVLIITIGAAVFASVVGVKMFAKAKQSLEKTDSDKQARYQCKRLLQRFAWLLLVILPIATAFTSSSSSMFASARRLSLSKLFTKVDPSSWKEAKATFLWMQFYPLLLLGLVALLLAYSMLSQRQKEGIFNSEEKP